MSNMSNESKEKTQVKYETFLNQKRLTKNDYYEYKKENKKYIDELYPANDYSLYSQNSKGEFNDKLNGQKLKEDLQNDLELKEKKLTIEWERISDRGDFSQIYNEKISHEQIEQGSLGNCYLMSLIASISHFPKLIIGEKNKESPHLLYNIEYGDIGYYEIMFFIDGNFKIVIIDDFIPFFKENGIAVFGQSSENYFWVNLVEKAYSKICGGYTSMDVDKNKNTYDHFQVFTGFKFERYTLYDEEKDKFIINQKEMQHIFKIIEENLKKDTQKFNTIITTGTPDENKGIYLEENYMPYKHSFSILDCKKIKINQEKDEMKLLLMNNPWGRNVYDEGIGKYCLENLNKDYINLKPYIESNLNSEDGSFWIDYDTFVKNYISINVCKIPCNYHCKNYSLSNEKDFELPLLYKLNIDKKTNIWFNLNISKSKSIINHFENKTIFKFLIINQINDEGKIIKTYSKTKGSDDIQECYDLEKGNYLIWLYIPKKYISDIDELNANFRVCYDNKIKIKFLNYDVDFKFITNACEYIFNIKNEKGINELKESYIQCLIDVKSINGLLILYFKNITKNRKLEAEPEVQYEGFKPIADDTKIDFKNLKLTLMPGECKYYIGISLALKSTLSLGEVKLGITECSEEKVNQKEYNFLDYIKEKDVVDRKFNITKYITNPYCFIKTNFNKNRDKRDEENLFQYFLNLMGQKLKPKGLSQEKIKIISIKIWNTMKEDEKEKIRQKYGTKKKEFKNNVIKTQVLKYIKRNSIKISDRNKMDNEIKNMKMKTRLSKELQIAQFEDDLDELEIKIRNILPKIEYLKETEKDEIELDAFITKQNSISDKLKELVKEKITKENAKQIDEKKCNLAKEYLLFSEKISKFLKKHEEKMKLFNEINEKGKKISEEINEKIKICGEKKLDLKKEVNNLIKKFKVLTEEVKKLKLIEINEKCNNDVIKKQKEIFTDIDTIQNGLKAVVESIEQKNKEKAKKQNELLPKEKFDTINKNQTDLTNELNTLKDNDKNLNDIIEIINEEIKLKKEFESLLNNIKESNLKESIDTFRKLETTNNKIGEKINNFQKIFIPKVNKFNEYIKKNDNCKKEILDIYEKFKENNLQINESLDKILNKMKELYDETKKLKIMDVIEKSKEMKSNWETNQKCYSNLIDKIKSLVEKKKGGTTVPSLENDNKKEDKKNKEIEDKKNKEIEDKINKDMEGLEKKQKEIIEILNKIKKDKVECLNDLNKILEEQDNALKNIKVVYKDDIKNINIQNIKDNFEKYKQFNDKYRQIIEKIKKISDKCGAFVKAYNEFGEKEYQNRKNIFENANKLQQNGIEIKGKNDKIIKKAEENLEELKKLNINELNEIFNKKVNMKMKDLSNVQEIVVNLLKKK